MINTLCLINVAFQDTPLNCRSWNKCHDVNGSSISCLLSDDFCLAVPSAVGYLWRHDHRKYTLNNM